MTSDMDIDTSNVCNRRIESSSEEEENDLNFGFAELEQEIQKMQIETQDKEEIFENFEELFETHSVKFSNQVLDLENKEKKRDTLGSEVLDHGHKKKKPQKTNYAPSFEDVSMIHGISQKWNDKKR